MITPFSYRHKRARHGVCLHDPSDRFDVIVFVDNNRRLHTTTHMQGIWLGPSWRASCSSASRTRSFYSQSHSQRCAYVSKRYWSIYSSSDRNNIIITAFVVIPFSRALYSLGLLVSITGVTVGATDVMCTVVIFQYDHYWLQLLFHCLLILFIK